MAKREDGSQFVARVTVIVPTSDHVEGMAYEASLGADGRLYSLHSVGNSRSRKSGNIAVQVMQMAIERLINCHLADRGV